MLVFLCWIGIHRPDRHRIWDDSINFRTKCQGCKKPMLKDYDNWRLFVPDDHRPARLAHPRSRQAK